MASVTYTEEVESFLLWVKEHHPDVVLGKDYQGDRMLMVHYLGRDLSLKFSPFYDD